MHSSRRLSAGSIDSKVSGTRPNLYEYSRNLVDYIALSDIRIFQTALLPRVLLPFKVYACDRDVIARQIVHQVK
jgi:hypothetical protein